MKIFNIDKWIKMFLCIKNELRVMYYKEMYVCVIIFFNSKIY